MIFKSYVSYFRLVISFLACGIAVDKVIGSKKGILFEGLSPITNRSETSTAIDVIRMMMPLREEDAPLRLFVIYDLENEDAASRLPQHLSNETITIVMYQFSEILNHLKEMLVPSAGTTIPLLLCTPKNILGLFETVNDRRLQSHFVHWLFIIDIDEVQADLTFNLEELIFEGTRVTLVAKQTEESFKLFSAQVDNSGHMRFVSLGQWDRMSNMGIDLLHIMSSDQHQQHLYSDMEGREMRVSALDYWPYLVLGKTLSDGTTEALSGLDVAILRTLSQRLNFTYRVISPADGQWGNPQPDGTVTGMIGDVARRDAHFALSGIATTNKRETVIDFSFPYSRGSFSMFSRAPKQRNKIFAIISPFSFQVWIYLAISVLAMGPLIYIISKLRQSNWETSKIDWNDLQSYYFNMFRSLVVQGNLLDANHWPVRFILLFWYLFCLNVSAMYSGMLTAVLAIPSYETPIDFLTDIPKAVENGFTLGIVGGTFLQFFFQEAKDGIYKEIWDSFNHENPSESFLPNDITGIERILKRKYVYFGALTECKALTTGLGRNRFHYARETFLPTGIGIPYPPGAPYKKTFDIWLMKMIEGGLLDKWLRDEMATIPKNTLGDDEETSQLAFSLSHLQAAFFLILIGSSLASMVLLGEMVLLYQ